MKPQEQVPRAPVVVDTLLRTKGVLNVHLKHRVVACDSVFSPSNWVKIGLAPFELLRTLDMPIKMDNVWLS